MVWVELRCLYFIKSTWNTSYLRPFYQRRDQLLYSLQLQTSTAMTFGAVIRPGVIRPLSVVKISPISRVCYHNIPQSSSTNGTPPIYFAPSFPDDFASSSFVLDGRKKANEAHKWDEKQATLSEAAVKADRGDIKVNEQPQTKTSTMENREPELDEM
ncbi:hypothetical protein N7517_000235 [Penicillium concentricum]|uniref:Uncharacterized protein n=1 Tax=Penicillium concentricum TaxID=293559 RepID=A0A9W9SRS6_9EURO|nr:uncharacterized protein N7517_000235 [Penicillium concentricum]KAJ5382324.1 hypothetical protein N7517_000235 [Penicillium concentricum]